MLTRMIGSIDLEMCFTGLYCTPDFGLLCNHTPPLVARPSSATKQTFPRGRRILVFRIPAPAYLRYVNRTPLEKIEIARYIAFCIPNPQRCRLDWRTPQWCRAQQIGMHILVVEALLVATYSTWVRANTYTHKKTPVDREPVSCE